jgi:predicted metal-dependent hydrolase
VSVLRVDDLELQLRFSPLRRTLQLTVDREGGLFLFAPAGCSSDEVKDFVREKRFWVYQKFAEKEIVKAPQAKKEYVTGEGFPYLGRSYRLLLVDDQDVPVKLTGGRFKMLRSVAGEGGDHMTAWYRERGQRWLEKRIDRLAKRTGAKPADVAVRELGYRWGSCARTGRLSFHWRTVMLPPGIVEYVVVHELSHLIEPHHGPAFWTRVERAMPDFGRRKQWLVENGARAIAM